MFYAERPRLFRWYRTLPLMAMGVVLALSIGLSALPTAVLRTLVYPVSYAETINDAAERYGVSPYLIAAVIKCESSWNEDAVSDAGAVGLMQLMPSTAQTLADQGIVNSSVYDPDNLTDAETNIEYGTAYLSYLQRQLSDTDEVIAAYNAGIGNVQSWLESGGDISSSIQYAETKIYLERVNSAMEGYESCYPSGLESDLITA